MSDPGLARMQREVDALRRRIERHERDHDRAEQARAEQAAERARERRRTRRYWITTLATVVGSNLATLLVVTLGRGHA